MIESVSMACPSAAQAVNRHESESSLTLPLRHQTPEYEVIKRYGKGAQASVYQARPLNSSQNPEETETFALKVFTEATSQSSIQNEVSVHDRLKGHPHILPCHAYSENKAKVQIPRRIPRYESDQFAKWRQGHETFENQNVMVLEECKYGDLFEYVAANQATRDSKLLKFLFLQVCQGLKAMHTELKLAHHDIKLENILVSNDGLLKLCDFGMVEPLDADIVKRNGTQIYMAPEVECKRPSETQTHKGLPVDIFSMGVLLWILHFGMPPFSSASSSDRNFAILQRNPAGFWRNHPAVRQYGAPVDEDFQSLLTSMLSIDISKRPESIEAVMQHQYFAKEADLIDALNNEWIGRDEIQAVFLAKLEALNLGQKSED